MIIKQTLHLHTGLWGLFDPERSSGQSFFLPLSLSWWCHFLDPQPVQEFLITRGVIGCWVVFRPQMDGTRTEGHYQVHFLPTIQWSRQMAWDPNGYFWLQYTAYMNILKKSCASCNLSDGMLSKHVWFKCHMLVNMNTLAWLHLAQYSKGSGTASF